MVLFTQFSPLGNNFPLDSLRFSFRGNPTKSKIVKNMKIIFYFFLIFNLENAVAASAQIFKFFKGGNEASVIILGGGKSIPGDFYIAKFNSGNKCYLEILKIVQNQALVDIRLCSQKQFLQQNQKLGNSNGLDDDVDVVPTDSLPNITLWDKDDFWEEKIERTFKFSGLAISLGYSLANTIDFSGTIPSPSTNSKTTLTGNFYSNGAPSISAEYLYSKTWNFGWNLQGNFQFGRNFDSADIYAVGPDFHGSIPNTRMFLAVIGINLNFTFPGDIIPYLGINTSLPVVSGGDISLSSQFGLQAGISKIVKERWVLDLQYQWVNFRGGAEIPNNVVQFTSAKFLGFLLEVKYLFN